ncbi:hypothetical protein NHF40_01195 [Maricaulaceae bacterium EIL42A08]|nr:hypothetical protein [Maricaulaceae bacterium EIL42A08]
MKRRAQSLPNQADAPVSGAPTVVKEALPHPWVHYSAYAPLLGFAASQEEPPSICTCSVNGVRKILEHHEKRRLGCYSSGKVFLPAFLGLHFKETEVKLDLDKMLMAEGVCHRCQQMTPTMRYCASMYGGKFRQFYGYYIELKRFEMGLLPSLADWQTAFLPEGIAQLCDELREITRKSEFLKKQQREQGGFQQELHDETYELDKLASRTATKINRFVENEVRKDFGFRAVGEGWISEAIMTDIVAQTFPGEEILKHHRPDWLNGLEIDCYLPRLKIGYEYQGQQHYKPVKAWGGTKALAAQKRRDEAKRQRCREAQILLVEIRFDEPLTRQTILKKTDEARKSEQ